MKWYQTKIGKTQIIGFTLGALLTLIQKFITDAPLQSIDYMLGEIIGGNAFVVFFIPSLIIPIFTKSQKIKLISVYIMIGLLILGFFGGL